MYYKPSSASATNDSNADKRSASCSSPQCAQPSNLHRRRLVNADARAANDLLLFRCPSPAETDPSVGVNGHVPLTVALVNQRLDYGNSTVAGIPAYLTRRMQSALNAAAR